MRKQKKNVEQSQRTALKTQNTPELLSSSHPSLDENHKMTQIDVLLQEYDNLAASIREHIQRIDRVRELYLAAGFGIIAFLVNSDKSPQVILDRIINDNIVLSFTLLIPILNAILLIHVVSYMHFILASSKYITHHLRPRITKLIGIPVFRWDIWDSRTGDKSVWVATRTLVGFLYYFFATVLSFAVLVYCSGAGHWRHGILPGLLYIGAVVAVSLTIIITVVYQWIGSHYYEAGEATDRVKRYRWYWLALPGGAILYGVLLWSTK
jgi:hypothetical protein